MKLNITGKITQFFLENRPLTILILIGILFAGVLSYILTPKQYNPDISMPAFSVIVDFSGASSEEVETFIVAELEEKIADVPGVDKIFSQSVDGGRAISFVQFKVGEDFETSRVKLTNKINGNLDLRSGNIQPPIIKPVSADDVPILTIGFWDKNLSQNQVRILAYDVMNRLKKIQNTANLEIYGGEPQALKIEIDSDLLKQRKIDLSDIKRAVLANNFRLKSGDIKNPNHIIELEVDGQFSSIESARKIMVAPGIKLEDVAKVFLGFREKKSFVQVFEKQKIQNMVFISVAKVKGSNAQTVSIKVQEALREILKNRKFSNLKSRIFRDEGEVSHKAVGGLMRNLITSIIIVSAVLWLFLGLRSASVVAIAIPLTLAGVFLVGYFSDKTINRITLFALILSLGLLVDSATVVIENIYRHLQKISTTTQDFVSARRKAIIEAVNEVGIGLFLSTLTSVIVFLPTSQISGMMGDYMGPLSFFLPVSLIISMFIAYILTPFLADVILPIHLKKEESLEESFFDKITQIYGKFLVVILDKPKFRKKFLFGIFGALFLVFTFPVFKLVHFKMLPSANKNHFFIYIDAPEGTNFPQTQKIANFVNDSLLQNPNIVSVQSFVGTHSVVDFNGLFKGSTRRILPHQATLRVNLLDKTKRSEKSTPILNAERKKILNKISLSPDKILKTSQFKFLEDPPGPPVRSTLMAKIKGSNRQTLESVAKEIKALFQETDRVVDIDTSIEKPVRKISFQVDHQKALSAGVTTDQIFQALSASTGEVTLSTLHSPSALEMIDIIVTSPLENRKNVSDLNKIFIKNVFGEMVPLQSVVKQLETRPQPTLYIDEREETVYVSGELDNRSVVYATIDLIFKIFDHYENILDWNLYHITFKTQTGETVKIEWGGEWEMTLDNFRDLGLAMIIAFIAIYAVLVAQFRSFKISFLVMSTIFLGMLGILPGFALLDVTLGTFLTATSLIGFIALMGIVVNNAIIYLEYFDLLREKGKSLRDALFISGKTRLRPILLTSITTVLGNLTIVTDPVWSGLAWAIVFGLSISAVFTLGVFPALMMQFVKEK